MTFEPPPLPEDVAAPQGERETLAGFLDYYRAVIVRKVAGLSREEATRRVVPSDSTLLGVVKHLGFVERGWFQSGIGGQTFEVPWSDEDPDADSLDDPHRRRPRVSARLARMRGCNSRRAPSPRSL